MISLYLIYVPLKLQKLNILLAADVKDQISTFTLHYSSTVSIECAEKFFANAPCQCSSSTELHSWAKKIHVSNTLEHCARVTYFPVWGLDFFFFNVLKAFIGLFILPSAGAEAK